MHVAVCSVPEIRLYLWLTLAEMSQRVFAGDFTASYGGQGLPL